MPRTKPFHSVCRLLVGVCTAAIAQAGQAPPQSAPAPGPALTLAQATAMAIQNHPQIAAAQSTAAEAGQHIREARAAYYPAVDGQITGSQGLFDSRLGAGSLSSSLLFSRNGEGLQLTQLVTDFGRTKNLVSRSEYEAQAAQAGTQATIFDVVLGVNRAWFEVLTTEAFLKVADETVKARQTLTDQVTALAKANLKSQIDVSFAEVNLSEAKLLQIRSQDAIDRAYSDLARALGQDQVVRYQLTEPDMPTQPPASAEPLIAQAIQNRPEMRNLQLQLQGAQSFERAEADLTKPNVSIIGVGGVLPYINQDPRVAPYGYEAVALNVDIPIFNGHLFSARREAARYESQAATQRVRNLQQQIERDVRTAWITASTAWQRIPVTEQLLKQAQLANELAQGRYNLGLASIVEITQAQLSITQAQIENVSAKYDYQSAFAQLQYTIGALR